MGRVGSLGRRLLALAAVWVLLALLVAGFALTDLFRRHVEADLTRAMEQHLDQLTAALSFRGKGEGRQLALARELSDPRFERPLSGLYWQVSQGGEVRLRSRSLWDQALPEGAPVPADGALHLRRASAPEGGTALIWERRVSLPDGDQPVDIAVVANAASVEAATGNFARVLALSLGVLALGLLAAALVQVRLGLVPLDRLRAALADLRAGRSTRVQGAFPSEVQPLVDDLNQVLADNADMVERARTQAGNLAHALKTPLAVIANSTHDMADAEGARLIAAETERMRRQIDHHLSRARAAAMARGAGLRTAVAPALAGLARTIPRLHPDRDIVIDMQVPDGLMFRGEGQDLQEMAGNLLDNAAKWCVGRIRLSAGPAGSGRLCITIADDGPGIPADRRAAVIARGIRLDEATPGTGLGLAIVDDLARLYGGALDLGHDTALGGLSARLTLPSV